MIAVRFPVFKSLFVRNNRFNNINLRTILTKYLSKAFGSKAELKKLFACSHPTLGLRVGSVGKDFFILVKVCLVAKALPPFDISLVTGKRTFIHHYRYNRK